MNRLVIIGNGFDLAHGLPTGYCDFIDWYWRNLGDRFQNLNELQYSDSFLSISLKFRQRSWNQALKDFDKLNTCLSFEGAISKYKIPQSYHNYTDYDDCKIIFKGVLFRKLSVLSENVKWVDIENEYYTLLKGYLKNTHDNIDDVQKLNKEFDEIKRLLEDYLIQNVNEKFNFKEKPKNYKSLINYFNIQHGLLRDVDIFNFLKEFTRDDHEELKIFDDKLKDYHNGESQNITELIHSQSANVQNLFLNFNYTKTLDIYKSLLFNNSEQYFGECRVIQIHGRLGDENNRINFGFGDEMDDDYKLLEKKDDNEYLKNIKSFQYLQNSNYKEMLDFIDSEKFQVYIMGHSCGLSDRILLNTIFEHQNCRSIKVFYYEKDGWDNYTDIVQNISRHFNKKKMMRDKIVNKSLCQPLPQNIRFAIK